VFDGVLAPLDQVPGSPFGSCGLARLARPPPGHRGVRRGFGGEQVRAHRLEGARHLLQPGGVAVGEGLRVRGACRGQVALDLGGDGTQAVAGLPGPAQPGQPVECRRLADEVADLVGHHDRSLEVAPGAGQVAAGGGGPGSDLQELDLSHAQQGRS
jgi:hypothetical protein